MREVLVSTWSGAGVVRAEHGLLVADDVNKGGGTYLRQEDRFQPVKSWSDQDRSVVGGLLPPGAVSAEVVDDRGLRVQAEVAGGASELDDPGDRARGRHTEYQIQIFPTLVTIAAGDRLRVTLSTTDTPHLVPLPEDLPKLAGGIYTIERSASAPSSLTLEVMK